MAGGGRFGPGGAPFSPRSGAGRPKPDAIPPKLQKKNVLGGGVGPTPGKEGRWAPCRLNHSGREQEVGKFFGGPPPQPVGCRPMRGHTTQLLLAAIPQGTCLVPSDPRSQALPGPPSTEVGDHSGTVGAASFLLFSPCCRRPSVGQEVGVVSPGQGAGRGPTPTQPATYCCEPIFRLLLKIAVGSAGTNVYTPIFGKAPCLTLSLCVWVGAPLLVGGVGGGHRAGAAPTPGVTYLVGWRA